MAKKKRAKKKNAIASNPRATEEHPAPDTEPVELPKEEAVEIAPEADVMHEEPEIPAEPAIEPPEPVDIEYSQPFTSPYAYPIATVRIGTKRYGIPVYYLQKHSHFKRYWEYNIGGEVVLRDVDEDIGHTIVHFLYTGRYETLYSGYDLATEYRRSAQAYEAARKYDLFGLERAARGQIEYFSPHVQLQNILETAREVLPNLPNDEKWFKDYLKEYFASSFAESSDFFQQEEFVKAMGQNTLFDKTIMRLTVDIMSTRIAELEATVELLNKQEPATNPESEPESDRVPYPAPRSESQSLPNEVPDSWSDIPAAIPPAEKDEEKEIIVDTGFSEEFPECDPGIPPAPPEGYKDGPPREAPRPDYPVEVYEDGVPSPRPQSPVESSPPPAPDPEPLNLHDAWPSFELKKKGKKKKKGSFAVEEVAQPPPVALNWA